MELYRNKDFEMLFFNNKEIPRFVPYTEPIDFIKEYLF